MSQRSPQIDEARHFLNKHGIPLFAILRIDALPEKLLANLRRACEDLTGYRSLILLGHGGLAFWESLLADGMQGDHPVDRFTLHLTRKLLHHHLGGGRYRILYPGNDPVALQQLGEQAGWGRPSLLGLSIHPRFGTWFAYRAAILVSPALPPGEQEISPSICQSCSGKPCISACPAGAVHQNGLFDFQSCVEFRLRHESPCRSTCLARVSCPVGREHQYTEAQLAYHAKVSLDSIKNHRDKVTARNS